MVFSSSSIIYYLMFISGEPNEEGITGHFDGYLMVVYRPQRNNIKTTYLCLLLFALFYVCGSNNVSIILIGFLNTVIVIAFCDFEQLA